MKGILFFLLLTLAFCWGATQRRNDPEGWYVCVKDGDTWSVKPGKEGGVAFGQAVDHTKQGWVLLTIETVNSYADEEQMYGAGFLEGYLEQPRMFSANQTQAAIQTVLSPNATLQAMLSDWLEQNLEWTNQQVKSHAQEPFWKFIGFNMLRFSGLLDGYNSAAPDDEKLRVEDLWLANGGADVMDILDSLSGFTYEGLSSQQAAIEFHRRTHCSGFIKFTGKDVLFGHTTWGLYSGLLRTFKTITFNLNDPSAKAKTISYSSYPGVLASQDDYYLTDQNLAIMETTNSLFNKTLTGMIKPDAGVLTWARTMAANQMAHDGSSWAESFSGSNPGTGNNQWMILDYKVLFEGDGNLLWIAEQIPGRIERLDVSDVLIGKGYWASYNIPYIKSIYDDSGYPSQVSKYGDEYSYDKCSRANIFRRDEGAVTSLSTLQKIMRYNDFKNDPLSLSDPTKSICARGDLGEQPFPMGGTDSKVTTADMMKAMSSSIQCGPTHDQQDVFTWNNPAVSWFPHFGQPDSFDFDWISVGNE